MSEIKVVSYTERFLDYEKDKMSKISSLLEKKREKEAKIETYVNSRAPKQTKKLSSLTEEKEEVVKKKDETEEWYDEQIANCEKVKATGIEQSYQKREKNVEKKEEKYEKTLLSLKKEYEDAVNRAKEEYERGIEYEDKDLERKNQFYETQFLQMKNGVEREYKKRLERVKDKDRKLARDIDTVKDNKLQPEYTLENEVKEIEMEILNLIDALESSRNSLITSNRDKKFLYDTGQYHNYKEYYKTDSFSIQPGEKIIPTKVSPVTPTILNSFILGEMSEQERQEARKKSLEEDRKELEKTQEPPPVPKPLKKRKIIPKRETTVINGVATYKTPLTHSKNIDYENDFD